MTSFKTFTYRMICGFFLGFSAFAPGFSGSVVAIAMGIYRDLITIISNPVAEIRKNIRLIVPLFVGAVISVGAFVVVFRFLFAQYEKLTFLLCVGLIAGNLPVIGKELRKYTIRKRDLCGGLASFSIALGISLVAIDSGGLSGNASTDIPFWELALGGFLAGAVAFIPGMSISAILIVTGVFGQLLFMLDALMQLQLGFLPHLIWIALCAVLGLVLTARGIKRIFDRYPAFANSAVLGFMAGTLIGIFIEALSLEDAAFHWGLGIVAILAGVGLSSVFVLLGKRMGTSAE
ncbi:MAG: DUF368 domain-containing protein [Oscillospiraceae bacterium]|nr:DUF368 domain-containing protein [Oscillospiraceae bacterium]